MMPCVFLSQHTVNGVSFVLDLNILCGCRIKRAIC